METIKQSSDSGCRCYSCDCLCKEIGTRFGSVTLDNELVTSYGTEPLETWMLRLYCDHCVPEAEPVILWGKPGEIATGPNERGSYCQGCKEEIPEQAEMWTISEYVFECATVDGSLDVPSAGALMIHCTKRFPGEPDIHWQPTSPKTTPPSLHLVK